MTDSTLLDTAAAAALLGISPTTLRQHARNGVPWLPAPTTVSGRYVWRAADLEGVRAPGRGRPRGVTETKPRTRRRPTAPPPDAQP